jgi:hypothetical protein
MPRPRTGHVVVRERAGGDRAYGLRFRAYGEKHYLTLGRASDGWSTDRAEAELRHVLADVERGLWQPPRTEPVEAPAAAQTFHEFASGWFVAREGEWAEATRADYHWQLTAHLLPFFADFPLRAIDVASVDRYRESKVRAWRDAADVEGASAIGPASINKTLTRLGQILDVALERDLIDRTTSA